MNQTITLVLAVYLALGFLMVWQIVSNVQTMCLLVACLVGVLIALRAKERHSRIIYQNALYLAIAFGAIMLFLTPAFWLILSVTIVFALIFLPRQRQNPSGKWVSFWHQKQYFSPRGVTEVADHGEKLVVAPNHWFRSAVYGEKIYSFDDLTIQLIGGDTIIDLGNTLLPSERDNVCIIQKGLGRTRILVPVGVGVKLEHSAFWGQVQLLNQGQIMRNQTMTWQNKEYGTVQRNIRIMSNVMIGDLEVVYV